MPVAETILVTGGTGKTGRRVVRRLHERGVAARVASRSGSGDDGVRFDWHDRSTFEPALDGVEAIYLVAPVDTTAMLAAMRPFLELALGRGTRRFVLLGASSLESGGPMMGEVHAWLAARVPEWIVLRPSWFMQNFSESHHSLSIRDEGLIRSATGDGRVGFVDAEDIAAVAVEALLAPATASGERVLTGPEALSYDDVARLVGEALGREVRHERLEPDVLASALRGFGVDAGLARLLAKMDASIAAGSEDRVTDGVWSVTGHPSGSFDAFVAREMATDKR